MTITEIIIALAPYKGPMTRDTIYKHFHALKIRPAGVRQRPQQWPDDAPARILKRLGIKKAAKRNGKRLSL